MQMPVFLTEPPQIHPSPSPRKQKKQTRRTRTNVYNDELALSLVPVVRSSRQEKNQGKSLETARSVRMLFCFVLPSQQFEGFFPPKF